MARAAEIEPRTVTGATPSAASSPAPAASPAPLPSPAAAAEPNPPAVAGPPIPPTPGASALAFRSDGAEIGPIVWAAAVDPRTKAPREAVGSFPIDAAVLYAVMPVVRMESGVELEAVWSYNGSPLDASGAAVVADRAASGAWLEFHLGRTGAVPWPDGIYAVRVLVDGAPALEAAVVVGTVPPAE